MHLFGSSEVDNNVRDLHHKSRLIGVVDNNQHQDSYSEHDDDDGYSNPVSGTPLSASGSGEFLIQKSHLDLCGFFLFLSFAISITVSCLSDLLFPSSLGTCVVPVQY